MATDAPLGLESFQHQAVHLPEDLVAAALRETERLFGGRPEFYCETDPSTGETLPTIEVHVIGDPNGLVDTECEWLASLAALGGRGRLGLKLVVDREG